MDEPETPAEGGDAGASAGPESSSESIVIATFQNSYAAERMVASLGHDFRRQARKGNGAAFVVTRHHDGSFKLVQSRVLTASGLASAAIGFTAAILAGLMGSMSAIRGAKSVTHGAHQRQSHVRQEDQRLTEILDQVGRHSAAVLIHCMDEPAGQTAAAKAADRGTQSWHISRAEFLAALDRLGDNYDWIRPAVAERAAKGRTKHPSPRKPPANS
jgi:uncharacterized membrane protein